MSEDDFVINLERCNRCGWNGYENLKTHSHCTNCNFSPEADDVSGNSYAVIPDWAIRALESSEFNDTGSETKSESKQLSAELAFVCLPALSA